MRSVGLVQRWFKRVTLPGLVLVALLLLRGCQKRHGCLGGDDGHCVPELACSALSYTCSKQSVSLSIVRGYQDRPQGAAAGAGRGDIKLENSRVTAIFDAPDSPHHFAPSGGSLIDFLPRAENAEDELNQVFHAVGILPDDAARYSSYETIEGDDSVAVVFRGTLDLRPDIDIVTRYELRSCEPGLRVTTDLYHGGRDPLAVFLSDAWFWGGRRSSPFAPIRGQGFEHPDLDLVDLDASFVKVPFLAARAQGPHGAAYGAVPCGPKSFAGFHSTTISALGLERTLLMPGDSLSFRRFLLAGEGPGLSELTGLVLEARGQLFGETNGLVSGRTVTPDGSPVGGDERLARLLVYEAAPGADPSAPSSRRPWTEVVPEPDGRFEVMLPRGKRYRIEAHVLGRPVFDGDEFTTTESHVELDDIEVPATARLDVEVTDRDGTPLIAEVVVVPARPTHRSDVAGSVYGQFDEEQCAPYLGPPHGPSPACNRILLDSSGSASVALPEGSFFVYATHGPFWTLAREKIEARAGEPTRVSLALEPLDLLPAGTVSADFHVHAGASFDSAFPELERVLTLVAEGIDVVVASDHDVITDYSSTVKSLGLDDRLEVMAGVETTGDILFLRPPGSDIPKVIGHYNFWPLVHDHDRSRNGAIVDDRLEPGELFDRMQSLYSSAGVAQMNHPFGYSEFGRDIGYLTALEYDPRSRVPDRPENTPAGQLRRRPGGQHDNLGYDAQEVMNGTSVIQFLRYRTGWFSFLNQGIVRAGTANSDSHTLAEQVVGYPRNIVLGDHELSRFDRDGFNADVRAGHMVGTNGPLVIACLLDREGNCQPPSREPVVTDSDAILRLEVLAAPFVPVEEIRFVVNGKVVETLENDALSHPTDPFSSAGLQRFRSELRLSEIVDESVREHDFWLVVEAGLPLPPAGDLDDDGLPETGDNDDNGVVDHRDERSEQDDRFVEPKSARESDPRFHLNAIAPGAWPIAFTNPWLVDVDGGDWQAPGLSR